jgi:RHS repeat-associated protein
MPQISLPKGGGAIRGIGEKFAANPLTGTASLTIPIATSPGRSGFGPRLSLTYDSGAGNGPFGFGWNLSLPAITRRTDKGLPRYQDELELDTFILAGMEDLVPVLVQDEQGRWNEQIIPPREGYRIKSYRPRIEGLFDRIERWTRQSDGDTHWRTISKDNVTSLYGQTAESRVADPEDPTRVFSWLICQSQDDRGNVILYSYVGEDAANVDLSQANERNRSVPERRFTNRYPARIRYGNTPSLLVQPEVSQLAWLFEVVFDYGEGYLQEDAPDAEGRVFASASMTPSGSWPSRQDPFSHYRSCFEVRTYRLCRRVLMFHHFAEELGTPDYLVRSTEFDYKDGAVASFIAAVTQSGYVRQPDGRYLKKSLPRLAFGYTEVRVDETVRDLDAQSLENLPYGADGARYQWIDLDSEGVTGVLTEQAGAWYYKRNLGSGSFAPIEEVASRPSVAALAGGQQHFLDLAGDGRLDLVQYDGPMPGFQTRAARGGWQHFTPFKSPANVRTGDPNLRFVDVTGDGFPDILVSEDTVFTWYESRAKDGFAPASRAPKSWNEEQGPTLVFADPAESIFLADMSGDGLSDIVRIRYGEVCYWPNIGYGRFGPKVTMDSAPVFESYDRFDPRRIRLADIDGSGTSDIIYVGQDGISLHFNQCGNSWAAPYRLAQFPRVDDLTALAAVDFEGHGTAYLVWSSPLESDGRRPMRYIDLMGGQKPHLLVHVTNNMGAETDIRYVASTKFYLQDRLEGHPWVTRLPFPVHVVERVEGRDLVSNTGLVSSYRYRHGYYDGVEREFRGFAYVEQRDAEQVIDAFDLPPVVTRTWFHNGAFLKEYSLEAYFKDPANQEFFSGDDKAAFLPDTDLPPNLTIEEMREAARALRGSLLRQEIYAEDGSAKAALPYTVSERSYQTVCLQPRGPNRYAVFLTHPDETLDYHYERNAADPRVSHGLTLTVDDYGNVLTSVSIGYARRAPAFPEQGQTLATLTESRYTDPVLQDDAYRTPLPAEVRTYELTAPTLAGAMPLAFAAVEALAAAAVEIAYEAEPDPAQATKRLIGQVRTLYRKDDLSALAPFGQAESMALSGEGYRLALTPGLLGIFQAKASAPDLAALLAGPEGQYRDLDADGRLWAPSGRAFYSRNTADSAAQELVFARAHFFNPHRFQDPFGNIATASYDPKYSLALVSSVDAVGNETAAEPDFRVLQPAMVTDPNGNRAEVRFDALGMPVGAALRGKTTGPIEGDSFDEFTTDLSPAQLSAFFASDDPATIGGALLGTATSRTVYDLDRVPVCAATIARETHVSDLAPGQQTKLQLRFVYGDGFGRQAQARAQAEPGPLDPEDPAAPVQSPRWVATGAKIYNNKNDAVRQYEPFFSATPGFGIETWGVGKTLFFDPLERVVATLHPDNCFEKIAFDPWQQASYDVNDTVVSDAKTDPDVGAFFGRLPDADYLPSWYQQRIGGAAGPAEQAAAQKAAQHADTPAVAHFDSLGRAFLAIADNGKDADGNEQKYATRTILDIEGNQRQVADALDRLVMHCDYDVLGTRIHQASIEAGERWMLNEVAGKPIRAWNSRGYAFRTEYDALRRPVRYFVEGGDPAEKNAEVFPQAILFDRTVYGDSADTGISDSQRKQANLCTRIFRHFDGAGIATTDEYDFKGNLKRAQRQLAETYKSSLDWSAAIPLGPELYETRTSYDALNRPLELTAPDKSTVRPTYNEANLLESLDVDLRGSGAVTPIVTNIDYDAKGRRTRIDYGNAVTTSYVYDPKTFRMTSLLTRRNAAAFPGDCPQPPPDGWPGCQVQNLSYTYDPVGNIAQIRDDAQQTVYFRNKRVEPSADYTYDALYRLTEATGREHLGQVGAAPRPLSYNDNPRVGLSQPGDGTAMGRYLQRYLYDAVGNFERMSHLGTDPANPGWTRTYSYDEASVLEPGKRSNRLTSTSIGATTETYSVAGDGYDAHGNMLRMPQLQLMQWDFQEQLHTTQRQAVNTDDADGLRHQGERTYYAYGAAGLRARKVTESQASAGQTPKRMNERIYLGEFEIYREYGADGTTIMLQRETLHIRDDKQRIVLVDTRTQGDDGASAQLIRYQLNNHLGSASLELDETARLISYEEYYPYGDTSYQAGRSEIEVSLKRYRYSGMERDTESGLNYHGARYLAPWLGAFTSVDPHFASMPHWTPYCYASANPVRYRDPSGRDSIQAQADLDANLRGVQQLENQVATTLAQYNQAKDDFLRFTPDSAAASRELASGRYDYAPPGSAEAVNRGLLNQRVERGMQVQARLKDMEGRLRDVGRELKGAHGFLEKKAPKILGKIEGPNAATYASQLTDARTRVGNTVTAIEGELDERLRPSSWEVRKVDLGRGGRGGPGGAGARVTRGGTGPPGGTGAGASGAAAEAGAGEGPSLTTQVETTVAEEGASRSGTFIKGVKNFGIEMVVGWAAGQVGSFVLWSGKDYATAADKERTAAVLSIIPQAAIPVAIDARLIGGMVYEPIIWSFHYGAYEKARADNPQLSDHDFNKQWDEDHPGGYDLPWNLRPEYQ